MSHPGEFEKASPVFSVIYPRKELLYPFEVELRLKWGEIELRSSDYPFPVDYYQKEMGEGLKRRFYLLKGLLPMDALVEMKLWAYGFEVYSSREGKRGINIDPALLFTPSLIVATFKPYSHRIPLRKGVYAHLELLFSRGKPKPLPWTYPDFASGTYSDFLEEAWRRHRARA